MSELEISEIDSDDHPSQAKSRENYPLDTLRNIQDMFIEINTVRDPKQLFNVLIIMKQNILMLVNSIQELSTVSKKEDKLRPTYAQCVEQIKYKIEEKNGPSEKTSSKKKKEIKSPISSISSPK